MLIPKDINEKFSTIRAQFINHPNEIVNPGVSEENKTPSTGPSFIFSSQMSKESLKYNNTYTLAGQSNILISPSSIPNPNPSTLGMKIDQCFQPYGPYIFPIQSFPGYQAMYPPIVSSAHSVIPSEPMRISTGIQHGAQIPSTVQSEIEKADNKVIVKSNIIELEKPKENIEIHQSVTVPVVDKDSHKGIIKSISTSSSNELPIVSSKSNPIKVDKQTGPNANSYVKIIKTTEIVTPSNSNTITTNTFHQNQNNGSFTLKTSIPISKIDMRNIQQPPVTSVVRNKPLMEFTESKPSDVQPSTQLPLRDSVKSIDQQIILKNDMKQNFFHQGNAVVHPHSIIKMLVPSQSSDLQSPVETNRNRPQIISDILLKPVDNPGFKSGENTFMTPTTHNLPMPKNNSNPSSITIQNEPEIQGTKTDVQIKPFENQQADLSKDIKKQYVFIPNPHMANKLLLSISSKQASNPILLPKVQSQEENRSNTTFAIPQLPERAKETNNTVTESTVDTNSKVVALKRLHHDNYDENDFENLITENQIYGNKIVIKEKSQPVFVHPASVVPSQSKVPKTDPIISKDLNSKANLVVQPNFLYVSNVKFQPNSPNFMVINNNTINPQPTVPDQPNNNKCNEIKADTINQASSQNKVMFGTQTFRTVNPITHTVSYVKTNNTVEANKQGTVLQTLLSKPNIKVNETNQTNKNGAAQKVIGQIMNNKIVYQVPMIIDRNNVTNRAVNVVKPTYLNSELAMLLTKNKNEQGDIQNDGKCGPIKNNLDTSNIEEIVVKPVCEEISSLDLAEKRKLLREKRKLVFSKKSETDGEASCMKEKEKYLSSQHYYYDDDSEESDEASDEEDVVSTVIKPTKTPLDAGEGKLEFLNMFGLTTKSVKKEKELDRLERSIKMDLVTSASVAAKAEKLTTQINSLESVEYGEQPYSLPIPIITENPINNDCKEKITEKIIFMNELKLGMVPHSYKIEHEMIWQNVLKERKRRNGSNSFTDYLEKTFKAQNFSNSANNNNIPIDIHTRDQLEIMTKIKQSVLENNNLIKLKLDKLNQTNEPDSDIPFLAEKNFSEIQKLSYMANKSLTILRVTQDLKDALFTGKLPIAVYNSLNQQHKQLVMPTNKDITNTSSHLNIPKIVSLKSIEVQCNNMDISPATSMDEPKSSAGGVNNNEDKFKIELPSPLPYSQSNEIQTDVTSVYSNSDTKTPFVWPGVQEIVESYKAYNSECEMERQRLLEKNEALRNEIAVKENEAGCLGAHLRLLLAEQQLCDEQRQTLQRSIDILTNSITQLLA